MGENSDNIMLLIHLSQTNTYGMSMLKSGATTIILWANISGREIGIELSCYFIMRKQ